LALGLELDIILDVLPFAAATRAKVGAAWVGAQRTVFQDFKQASFGKLFPALEDASPHAVARYGSGYKHDVTVAPRQ